MLRGGNILERVWRQSRGDEATEEKNCIAVLLLWVQIDRQTDRQAVFIVCLPIWLSSAVRPD
jgi:hypothetical protein